MSILISFIPVFLAALFFFGVHFVAWRFWPSPHPRISHLLVLGMLSCVLALLLALQLTTLLSVECLALSGLQFLIVIGYIFFYAGIARSVTVTMLIRFLEQGNHAMDFNEFIREYNESTRFSDRLILMEKLGLITINGPQTILTPRGSFTARWVGRLNLWLGIQLEG